MRNTYYNRQPDLKKSNNIDQDYHVGLATLLLHSFMIALQLAFTISFLILMLYFINQSILINSPGQQIQIVISIVLWLAFTIVILSSISKQLIALCISDFLFFATYTFSALPTTQLIINILQYINNGVLSAIPFIIFMIIINITFVTVTVLCLSRAKMSNVKTKILFIILIIFCATVSYINMLF